MATKMTTNKKHIITLSFTTLLVLLLLTFFLGVSYKNLNVMTENYQENMAREKEHEWSYINSVIVENQSKSIIQVNDVRDQIENQLISAYSNNMNQLRYDMDNLSVNSPYAKILSSNIMGKYINKDNDNNDMFIAELNLPSKDSKYPDFTIISDHSYNCSKEGVRDAKKELAMHYNPVLGLDAIKRIVNQNTSSIIFWEFLKSNNPNHFIIKTDNINSLKKVFMSEGITGLSTYEVCNVAYIEKDRVDIFRMPDIDNLGQKSNNYKIIVYQGFSITDALNTSHSLDIQQFENNKKFLTTEYNHERAEYILEILSVVTIMVIVFITLVRIQNLMLEIEAMRRQ